MCAVVFALEVCIGLFAPRFELLVASIRLSELVAASSPTANDRDKECRQFALDHLKTIQDVLGKSAFRELTVREFQFASDALDAFDLWLPLDNTNCVARYRAAMAFLDTLERNPPKAEGEFAEYTRRWIPAQITSTRTRIHKRYAEVFRRTG